MMTINKYIYIYTQDKTMENQPIESGFETLLVKKYANGGYMTLLMSKLEALLPRVLLPWSSWGVWDFEKEMLGWLVIHTHI